MHRPQLLILDEPTSGLDPLNQQEFYSLVREAREDGATVLLSSHVLSEVEHVCDQVAIIRAGRLVRVAELDDLHDIRFHRVEIEFAGPPPATEIAKATGVDDVRVAGTHLTCTVHGSFEPFLDALRGAEVLNLVSHEPSLEDVFLTYYKDDRRLLAGHSG
jgi:ABC-2 type transport system ATP-binding protein